MKRLLSLLVLIMFCVMGAIAKGDKVPKYDITGAGSGTEGTLLVKVYVYKNKVADEDFKLAAVHGVVSEDARAMKVERVNRQWLLQQPKRTTLRFAQAFSPQTATVRNMPV